MGEEKARILAKESETEMAIGEATFNVKMYDQGKLVELVDQVEAKTEEANLLRSKADKLAVSGIYNRTCGNRDRANEELLRVARCIEESIVLDGEISEHSSQLIYFSRQIEISEHVRSRAQNIMREVEHDLERVQFHIVKSSSGVTRIFVSSPSG